MQKQQLHDEDVLRYHSLMQRGVAFVVRDIDGSPMLERETVQSKGTLTATDAESRWVDTVKFFQLSCMSEISLKMLGFNTEKKDLCTQIFTVAFIILAEKGHLNV